MHLFISGIVTVVGFGLLTWCILKFTEWNSQRNLENEVATRGISMQNMPGKFKNV